MLKIFHTILLLIAVTFSYAQTKKNKVNVKFNIDKFIYISKLKDWRINEMGKKFSIINKEGIMPSLFINNNEKWEIGITYCHFDESYQLKYDENWKEKVRYSNTDSLLLSDRSIQSLDISFGYNIKNYIFKSDTVSTFIAKSNLYFYLSTKILLYWNTQYSYYYVFPSNQFPHYIASDPYTIKRKLALRPKIELTYSYDVFKWLQLRANINYSYIFKDDAPFIFQAGIGFKF